MIHGSCHVVISFDPTLTLGIEDLGHCRYWLIGAWSKFKSPSIDYSSLVALGLEGFGYATWGAHMLMTICRPTFGSNVISPICHQLQYWEDL
jgi:hypothetical protein